MTTGKFTTSAAILALIAGLGGAAIAQTTPEAPATAPVAPAVEALPEALTALNLQDVEIKTKRGLREVEGRMPDGVEIEAKIGMNGEFVEIEADDGVLPQSLVDQMLPQSVQASQVFSQFATIDEIESRRGVFMIKGEDAGGEDMRAALDPEGRVMGFGRGDDHRRGGHGKGMRDGPRGHGDHMERGEGPRGEHGRGGGPRGERFGGAMPEPGFDPVSAQQQLTDAGYTQFGFLRMNGPRSLIEATNPQGEAVLLELDPAGELVRETAR